MPVLNQTFELPQARNDPGGHLVLAFTRGGNSDFPSVDTFNQAVESMIPVWAALQSRLSPSHAIALAMLFAEHAHFLQEQHNEDARTSRNQPRSIAN